MSEGEEVEVASEAPARVAVGGVGTEGAASGAAGGLREIAVTEDVPPDKWRLRRDWFRLAWMVFVVGVVFSGVWISYEMQWGATAVVAVALLELPFFLLALNSWIGIVRKRKRTRVVTVRKIAT
jgi:hypothetical protein